MNCKRKLLALLILLFLVTGCSANYNIEIYNETVKEELSLLESDSTKFDSLFLLNQYETNDPEGDAAAFTYRQLAQKEATVKTQSFLEDASKYYKKTLIEDENQIGVKYQYSFDLLEYSQSFIPNQIYRHVEVLRDRELIILSTSSSDAAFTIFPVLDTLEVQISTNHKVKSSNADEVNGTSYTWHIDKNNAKDKKIYIELYREKFVSNYRNWYFKALIGIIVVAFLTVIVIIILKKKARSRNRV